MEITNGFDLSTYRRRRGIRQHELAHRLGCSSAAISQLERGLIRPTPERIAVLVAAIDELAALPRREVVESVFAASAV